jgi:chaperone BCS1
MSLWAWLWDQLQHNQFLVAALVAMPAAALSYAVRNIPVRIYHFAKHQLSFEVRFNSDLNDYQAIQEFIADKIVSPRFTRNFVYMTERKWNDEIEGFDKTKPKLTPGYGDHFGWWKRRMVTVQRSQIENQGNTFKEQVTLTFYTRNRDVVQGFIDELCEHIEYRANTDFVPMYINGGDYWRFGARLPKRPLSTVFLNNNDKQRVLDHINNFVDRRDWYRERGLPWHTGILLTGKPGTGKTSLVHALASELDRTVYYLNLGSLGSDAELNALVSASRDWQRGILVIEDADAGNVSVAPAADEETRSARPARRKKRSRYRCRPCSTCSTGF